MNGQTSGQAENLHRLRGKLRWRCRRGLKELDRFFEPFVATGLGHLGHRQLALLEQLLETPDPDLLQWCSGAEPVPDPALQPLIALIQAARHGGR